MAPFQFHNAPNEEDTPMDHDPNDNYNGDPFTGQYVSHQIFMQK